MDNLRFWKQLATPPPSSLKTIKGGRLQGMTDINPQWRLEVMTEVFGPCGIGWQYTIDRLWTEKAGDIEILAFATVLVSIRVDDEWSEPVPGIGGNKLISKESSGPHNNDECFKMAITDALSVAFKALGVASDIYAGLWDGSKYHKRPEDAVTKDQLNSLKQKYAAKHKDELEGLDRPDQLQHFNSWCRIICGELVDYNDPTSWTVDWYKLCLDALKSKAQVASSDVPFEE